MNAIDFACREYGAKAGERCPTYTGKWQPVAHAKRIKSPLKKRCVVTQPKKKPKSTRR